MATTKDGYKVGTLRAAGLEARWSRNRKGAPILVARDPQAGSAHQRQQWWHVDRAMWAAMERSGIREGFDGATLLGDLFRVEV